jgi:hypothetical protein
MIVKSLNLVPRLVMAALLFSALPALSQAASKDALLHATEAAKVLPSAVFFRGQSATTQTRNSGGVKYGDGMFVLATLVDNSGYSSGIQAKYQAYFITEVTLDVNGHKLAPGAYGVGIVAGGHFGVMDIGAHDLFSADATNDKEFRRPTPLQVIADSQANHYRLYFGRNYVTFSRSE